jgi:diguanylate cyclase (GGDEF)-like protein
MAAAYSRTEDRLRLELEKSLPRLDFDPLLQARYRGAIRNGRRLGRTLYYLIPALLYGALGLSGGSAAMPALLGRLGPGLFVPLFLLAAVANLGRLSERLTSAMHVVASLALWCGILALQVASGPGATAFPPEVLATALLGAALLCGFRLRPMLWGIAVFSLLDLLLASGAGGGRPSMDAVLVTVLGGCAAGGACLAEASRRRQWIASQIADCAARCDPLTGLDSRAEFNLRFPLLVAQARRERLPLSLALIAIDDFRAINEKFNHLYGDLVLRRVAEQAQRFGKRPLDLKARFAGGKLALVWYNSEPAAAAELTRELLQAVRVLQLERPARGTAPRLSLSVGVLGLVPQERTTPSEVLRQADALMYQARGAGGDRLIARSLIEPAEPAEPPQALTQAALTH